MGRYFMMCVTGWDLVGGNYHPGECCSQDWLDKMKVVMAT